MMKAFMNIFQEWDTLVNETKNNSDNTTEKKSCRKLCAHLQDDSITPHHRFKSQKILTQQT
jgi:hypothetical protein